MIYCDQNLIVNTERLVEAHLLNGSGEMDGLYVIVLIIHTNGTFLERFAPFPTKEARDKAFVALGMAVTMSEKC